MNVYSTPNMRPILQFEYPLRLESILKALNKLTSLRSGDEEKKRVYFVSTAHYLTVGMVAEGFTAEYIITPIIRQRTPVRFSVPYKFTSMAVERANKSKELIILAAGSNIKIGDSKIKTEELISLKHTLSGQMSEAEFNVEVWLPSATLEAIVPVTPASELATKKPSKKKETEADDKNPGMYLVSIDKSQAQVKLLEGKKVKDKWKDLEINGQVRNGTQICIPADILQTTVDLQGLVKDYNIRVRFGKGFGCLISGDLSVRWERDEKEEAKLTGKAKPAPKKPASKSAKKDRQIKRGKLTKLFAVPI